MNKVLKGLVTSSANPEKVSMTIQGILVANIAIIMYFVHKFNLPYTAEQVTEIIGVLSGAISAIMVTFGLLRKLWYKIRLQKD